MSAAPQNDPFAVVPVEALTRRSERFVCPHLPGRPTLSARVCVERQVRAVEVGRNTGEHVRRLELERCARCSLGPVIAATTTEDQPDRPAARKPHPRRGRRAHEEPALDEATVRRAQIAAAVQDAQLRRAMAERTEAPSAPPAEPDELAEDLDVERAALPTAPAPEAPVTNDPPHEIQPEPPPAPPPAEEPSDEASTAPITPDPLPEETTPVTTTKTPDAGESRDPVPCIVTNCKTPVVWRADTPEPARAVCAAHRQRARLIQRQRIIGLPEAIAAMIAEQSPPAVRSSRAKAAPVKAAPVKTAAKSAKAAPKKPAPAKPAAKRLRGEAVREALRAYAARTPAPAPSAPASPVPPATPAPIPAALTALVPALRLWELLEQAAQPLLAQMEAIRGGR